MEVLLLQETVPSVHAELEQVLVFLTLRLLLILILHLHIQVVLELAVQVSIFLIAERQIILLSL